MKNWFVKTYYFSLSSFQNFDPGINIDKSNQAKLIEFCDVHIIFYSNFKYQFLTPNLAPVWNDICFKE